MQVRKIILTAVCAFTLVAIFSGAASAQGVKMGFVDDEAIKQQYKAWTKAQEQWKVEAGAWEEEAQSKQEELVDFAADYERQRLILSDEKKTEREATLRAKQDALDAFTRDVFGPGGKAERKHAQLVEPLLNKITEAIEAVAIDGEYDVIFTMQSGLGYIRETLDVTDKVLVWLEENEE